MLKIMYFVDNGLDLFYTFSELIVLLIIVGI